MTKKSAMSTMGYAIVLVIILGIVMIVSAPMMMNNMKRDKNSAQDDIYNSKRNRDNRENIDEQRDYRPEEDMSRQLRMIEERMNTRLDALESRQVQRPTSAQSASDKYVCEIEGNVDADGNVIPIDNMSMDEVRRRKIVFVCEYRN